MCFKAIFQFWERSPLDMQIEGDQGPIKWKIAIYPIKFAFYSEIWKFDLASMIGFRQQYSKSK